MDHADDVEVLKQVEEMQANVDVGMNLLPQTIDSIYICASDTLTGTFIISVVYQRCLSGINQWLQIKRTNGEII